MPYVKDYLRANLEPEVTPTDAGELNYVITRNCIKYAISEGRSYTTYNEIIGALECAKQEFYRRMIVEYEEGKIADNGDVY